MPSPDVRAAFVSKIRVHKFSHIEVLHAMISAHPARAPVDLDCFLEQAEHRSRSVIIACAEGNYKP